MQLHLSKIKKNMTLFYYKELSFGIIPVVCFLNIETMNIIFSYAEDEIALFQMACEEY